MKGDNCEQQSNEMFDLGRTVTITSISCVAWEASTVIRANTVIAVCMSTAIVHIVFAFICVLTWHAISMESFDTSTMIRANGVNAVCTYTAVRHFAFIYILTWHPISLESFSTATVIRTNGIVALCMDTTIVNTGAAFINVCAHLSITIVSRETNAPVGANGVFTFGVRRARMKFLG